MTEIERLRKENELLRRDLDALQRGLVDQDRALLASIIECSTDAIISLDGDGNITSWNRAASGLFGFAAEEVVGHSILLLVPPERWQEELEIRARIEQSHSVERFDTVRLTKGGAPVEVSVTVSPIKDASGKVVGSSSILHDLTSLRRAEVALRRTQEQLLHAQKLEAVGLLAGGIAHDFNNLLSVILSYTDLCLAVTARDDDRCQDLEEVKRAALRAAELTHQLLAFSRQQILQPRVLDVSETLLGVERMLRRVVGEDVELIVRSSAGLGRIVADAGQLEQIVTNLVINARDAMPGGGTLTVEATNAEIEATDDPAGATVPSGDYVAIAVSDTGIGMDGDTRARIFEPFFTTKEKGRGTGLGLSTVFGIVQQSRGHIIVESEPGRGSTFKVFFPRHRGAVTAQSMPPVPKRLSGSETILLVEDEDQLRTVVCAILRRRGYRVLEARSPAEALRAAGDHAGPIDLLLTDVIMPQMNGRELAERLATQRPGMRTLYASGYTDHAIVNQFILDANLAFLQKPVTPDSLLRKVREVLDETPA